MFRKIKEWYSAQSDSVKAMLWIGIVCIAGIILRWDAVLEGVKKGFDFYSNR